ncbi:class I adenylate-forming enzyme family protein [Myxococcus sp. SDU36]|uniref:class I adenylate-forming enzyme family protein n=1 Tax=Myxococcus sp. SDU36 TaxID=2831967 RepID=UPI002542BC77|nr:class I adenylate-forming enzyme family protein [Myxococcus sp. SDU36]WIG95676.1 acyl--CoA ligase [Myxococcus sp. SDU36]
MTPRHLSNLLDEAERLHGARPFLQDERTSCSYADLAAITRRLGGWLAALGVRRGDRVVILTRNRVEVALAAFATARIGGVFAVLHGGIREQGLRKILDQVTPAVAFLDETTAHLAPALGAVPIVWVGGGAVPPSGHLLERLLADEQRECPPFSGTDVDPVCLVYTSGSTGAPRGVTLSHDNILFVVAAIQARLQYAREDVVGVFVPLSFDYGLYQVFLAAQVGAAVFVGGAELAGPALVATLARQRVTVLPGVPTLFAALLMLLERGGTGGLVLRALTNTGAHLPASHVSRLRELLPGVLVFPMYGLTECKRVSILLPEELEAHPGSVGRALPGTEAMILDEVGRVVPPGGVGELVIQGRHVALGYWEAPEETALRYRPHPRNLGRVLYSGDLFRMDAEGFLQFVGRKDFLLKRRGFRIHPLEIEEVACALPGVAEAGVAQEAGSDRLHLFVAAAGGPDAPPGREAGVLDALSSRLETHKVPDRVHWVLELPRTPNGKLDRGALAGWVEREARP